MVEILGEVWTCDICGTQKEIPRTGYHGCLPNISPPLNWILRNGVHLCPLCYEVYE